MKLLLFFCFVGCFGWDRHWWNGLCTACPAKFYQQDDCERNAAVLDGERKCKTAKCEGRCKVHEKDLCGWNAGNLKGGEIPREGDVDYLSDSECANLCAINNYVGSKQATFQGHDRCYCLREIIGSLDTMAPGNRSCEFTLEPAYVTQERKKCDGDNGQVLTEQHCKYHLPKEPRKFGSYSETQNIATMPAGCYTRNGMRYWNQHSTGDFGDANTYLICRGAEPITAFSQGSTGQCPGGQQLTEFECQYQITEYGTWDHAFESSSSTCGCFVEDNQRHFNRHTASCQAGKGESMVCKKIVPSELCLHIVDVVEASEENGQIPEQVEYLGQTINIMWDVVKWDPTTECVVTEQRKITGPTKCSDPTSCGVSFEHVESQTMAWSAGMGAVISASVGFEFSAGIPLIFQIEGDLEVSVEYDLHFDLSGESTIESHYTQALTCNDYDTIMNCYVFAIESRFNTTATASPQFWLVDQGEDDPRLVHCYNEFGIATEINWEAKSGSGYEAREVPVCTDTEGVCDLANFNNCATDDYTREHCPATCSQFGLGPPACPCQEGYDCPACGFVEVPADKCPAPSQLDKEGSTFPDCLTVFNGPPMLCQATMPWPDGSGPEDWFVQNCPDGDGYYYNIFAYGCDVAEQEAYNAQLREQYSSAGGSGHGASNTALTSANSQALRGSQENSITARLKDAEVDNAFDTIYEEAIEIKNFNLRLQEVNVILKETLQELKK